MSIFANEEGMVGTRLYPDTSTGDSGFEALGKPVPFHRRQAAGMHMKDMGVQDAEARFSCVERMCVSIERDDPHGALRDAYEHVDVCGAYRLLAVLLTSEPKP